MDGGHIRYWVIFFVLILILSFPLAGADDQDSSEISIETRSDNFGLQEILGYGSMIGFLNSIQTGDVDNDGTEEVVFGNKEGCIFVAERDGDTMSREWVSPFMGGATYGLALGDIDSDSTIEIIVGSGNGVVRVFGWDGSQFIMEWESKDLGSYAYGLAVGDMDNDQQPEIAIGTGSISLQYYPTGWMASSVGLPVYDNLFIFGYHDGTYQQECNFSLMSDSEYGVGKGLYNIAIGDTDGDSLNEIVVGSFQTDFESGQDVGFIEILGFNEDGFSIEWTSRELSNWVMGLALGDTDNDGTTEIVTAVWNDAAYIYGLLGNNYVQEWRSVVQSPFCLAVGNIDSDDTPEFMISDEDMVTLYDHTGLAYLPSWNQRSLDPFVSGLGIFHDQSDKFIIAPDTSMLLYERVGSGYSNTAGVDGMGRLESTAGGDLDNDGIDEMYALSSTGVITILQNQDGSMKIEDSFTVARNGLSFFSSERYTNICVDDFDDDGQLEIVAVEGNTSAWYVDEDWDNGVFHYWTRAATLFFIELGESGLYIADSQYIDGNSVFSLDTGDVDNDGKAEVVVGGTGGDLFVVGYDNGSCTIETRTHPSDSGIMSVATGDVDGDGIMEIGLGDGLNSDHPQIIIVDYSDGEYSVLWRTTLLEVWYGLDALEMGSIDGDALDEIYAKPLNWAPVQVFGRTNDGFEELDRIEDFSSVADDAFTFGDLPLEDNGELLLGTANPGIVGFGYSTIWEQDSYGAVPTGSMISDVDQYGGNEAVLILDSLVLVYGATGPPKPVLTASTTEAFIDEKITFDGSGSYGDGSLEYFFDFGDGVDSGWVSDPTVSHNYSRGGEFTASLKVREGELVSPNSDKIEITIIKPNVAPSVWIEDIDPSPAYFGEEVNFKGGGDDPDGSIWEFEWSSDIDGIFGDEMDIVHSGLSIGEHTISFRVMDDNNTWSETVSRSLSIVEPSTNQRPVGFIEAITPNPANIGDTIRFSGYGEDQDGTITGYEWESDKDGLLSNSGSFMLSTLSEGTHNISFKVKDNEDSWSNSALDVLVIGRDIQIPPPENLPPQAFIEEVYPLTVEEGEAVYFYGVGSDTDGFIDGYEWESDIDGILSYEQGFETTVLSVGYHNISFRVMDNNGKYSESAKTGITIEPAKIVEDDETEKDDSTNYVLYASFGLIVLLVIVFIFVLMKKGK